jgi:hypothetical protein
MFRILILFLPSLFGLLWQSAPEIFMVWALTGSYFIATITQTQWFRQTDGSVPLTHRLLAPSFSFHLYFISLHVVGGGFYFLDAIGFSYWQRVGASSEFEMPLIAKAQGLMLLAHASVTVGMKLAGSKADRPWFQMSNIPPYGLTILSITLIIAGLVAKSFAGLQSLSFLLMQVASSAVIVELTFAVVQRELKCIVLSSILLVFNLLSLSRSGWKSPILWLMLSLCAMLYPLNPRRVLLVACGFGLVWLLYFYPFTMALRPLVWQSETDEKTAIEISLETALRMSLKERVDLVWDILVIRANELYQFKKYLAWVPARHPYFGLDLVKEAALGLVPRVIWPEKPQLEPIVMQRVYEAGIVSETAVVSAKPNLYQDAYLSWDWIAIILFSGMFGFVFMLLNRMAERLFGGYEIGTCLIFTALFGDSFRSAPNLLFLVGSTSLSFLVMVLLFLLGRAIGWISPAHVESTRDNLADLPLSNFLTE